MSGTEHPRPARDTTHQCPHRECSRRVARNQLACPRHWARVDQHTKKRVYAAYRSGDMAAHVEAMAAAIEEMNANPAQPTRGTTP